MVTISAPGPVVQEIIDPGTSLTVPSGEVWKVHCQCGPTRGDRFGLDVNGFTVYGRVGANSNKDRRYGTTYGFKTVFVGGDTLTVGSSFNSGSLILTGFEVSSLIDNTPVSIQAGHRTDVTVPNGETWSVGILAGSTAHASTSLRIDGSTVHTGFQDDQKGGESGYLPAVLKSGTTIAAHALFTSSPELHVGGFVI